MLQYIFNTILYLAILPLLSFLDVIVNFIPPFNVLSDSVYISSVAWGAVAWFHNTMYALDPILPVTLQKFILLYVTTYYVIKLFTRTFAFAIKKIPFLNMG